MQTAFVTGSTGLFGNDLVRLLAGRGGSGQGTRAVT